MCARCTQSWSLQLILKGSFGSFMSCSNESSVAKMKANTRFTYVTDSVVSPGFTMRMAACKSSFVTSPYQNTHFSSGPSTGSSFLSIPLASCVRTSCSISGVVKNSRARGCAYCSHCLITFWISSSVRGWKADSFLLELAFLCGTFFAFFRSPSLSFCCCPKSAVKGFSEHMRHWNMARCGQQACTTRIAWMNCSLCPAGAAGDTA
mmetsp:Transcript_118456/g.382441  ORF Transcript_118456/g.382441 Transcript_118456/m.382441 type:complete len:206 (-) Transcript_118456:4-621(-)